MEKNQYDLKQILQESGVSQSALAQKLGVSRQHLHNIIKLNRKSKYSDKIFDLLKQGCSNVITESKYEINSKEIHKIESLPMVFPEDIIRIYSGSASINLLNKPFYAKYPFINFTNEENQFCLRLIDLFYDSLYIAVGAFRLTLSLDFKKDQIMLLYLPDLQKVVAGRANINPDTKEKLIVNNKAVYTLRFHDMLIAECTQAIHFLP